MSMEAAVPGFLAPAGSPECCLNGGDTRALATVLEAHRHRLLRLIGHRLDRRLHGRVDPDDILQEAFLAAARRLPYYDAAASPSPYVWLRLVVLQTMVDVHRFHLRAQRRDVEREQAFPTPAPRATSGELARSLMSPGTSPSQVVVQRETIDQLERALTSLDPRDQEVLELRHFEELTNMEVAEVLGIQPKAASLRYVRAVRRLRQVLADLSGFFDACPLS